jgi:hypothetical protein
VKKTVLYICTSRTMLAAELSDLVRHPSIKGGELLIESVSPGSPEEHHELVKRHRPVLVVLPHRRVGAPDSLGYAPPASSLKEAEHLRFTYDPSRNRRTLDRYQAAA